MISSISNIEKFSVVEDHLAYIHSEVGLGVRLFFCFSLRCCHRRVVIFNEKSSRFGVMKFSPFLMEPWVARFGGRFWFVGGKKQRRQIGKGWKGLKGIYREEQ